MKTAVIIPAGGRGSRMGGEIQKQYLMLGGMPILVRTLYAFQEAPLVDDIYLVLPADDLGRAQEQILSRYNLSKVKQVLRGGERRQDSVKAGVSALDVDYDIVLIHDGVRPFVSQAIIRRVIQEARQSKAVAIGIPAGDTVKKIDNCGFIVETLNRDQLWLTQTPQAFAASLLRKAYDIAYRDNYYGTDDASLVERMGTKVKMLPGSANNIKITTPVDLQWGEFYLKYAVEEESDEPH